MGVWCAKTAWAHWRQQLTFEVVNNQKETIACHAIGVAKAIAHRDDTHDVRVKDPHAEFASFDVTRFLGAGGAAAGRGRDCASGSAVQCA